MNRIPNKAKILEEFGYEFEQALEQLYRAWTASKKEINITIDDMEIMIWKSGTIADRMTTEEYYDAVN